MKISLKLITCCVSAKYLFHPTFILSYVFVLQMLQEFEFSVCPLRQNRRAERLHDLLHRHRLSGELILRRAVYVSSGPCISVAHRCAAYHTSPNAPIPTGCRSVYLPAISMFASHYTATQVQSHIPARNLEGSPEDLRTHELRHLACGVWYSMLMLE